MAKALVIGPTEFPTKAAAHIHFQAMLRRYADGQRVDNALDHAELLGLVQRLDKVIEAFGGPPKSGCGVSHFERRMNWRTGYRAVPGFWVVRTDGTATDFSYRKAVDGLPKDIVKKFYEACRAAVSGDLVVAKRKAFTDHGDANHRVKCEITGKPVAYTEAHIDHAWMYFSQIVHCFRVEKGWVNDIPDGVVSSSGNGRIGAEFVKAAVAEEFRKFHRDRSVLRIVAAEENARMSSLARRPRVARPVHIQNANAAEVK